MQQFLRPLTHSRASRNVKVTRVQFLSPIIYRDREKHRFLLSRDRDDVFLQRDDGEALQPVAVLTSSQSEPGETEERAANDLLHSMIDRLNTPITPYPTECALFFRSELYRPEVIGPAFQLLEFLETNGRVFRGKIDLSLEAVKRNALSEFSRVGYLLEAGLHIPGSMPAFCFRHIHFTLPHSINDLNVFTKRCRSATQAWAYGQANGENEELTDVVVVDQCSRVLLSFQARSVESEYTYERGTGFITASTVLSINECDVIMLEEGRAADYGESMGTALYSKNEIVDIERTAMPRRRQRVAGKLAVKLLAASTSDPELLRQFEVMSDGPVRVKDMQGNKVEAVSYSISHSTGMVCAARSDRPVGIDIEAIRELDDDLVEAVGPTSLWREADRYLARFNFDEIELDRRSLYGLIVFTQKEAVLKASGVGLSEGIDNVSLGSFGIGAQIQATHQGRTYTVITSLNKQYVVSVARYKGTDQVLNEDLASKPSYGQQAIWFLERLSDVGSAFNLGATLRLYGPLRVQELEEALQATIDRHRNLKSRFTEVDGSCRIVISENATIGDISELGPIDVERVQAIVDAPFDLGTGPLFRFKLAVQGLDDHLLVMVFHHSVFDGYSWVPFMDELQKRYRSLVEGGPPSLIAFHSYDEFVQEEHDLLTRNRRGFSEYWRAALDGCPFKLHYPIEVSASSARDHYARLESIQIPADLISDLRALARNEGVTLHVVMLSAFQVMLARWCNQRDFVISSPFSGRTQVHHNHIGLLVNPIPIRARIQYDTTSQALFQVNREQLLDALEHLMPFSSLVSCLDVKERGQSPVTQVSFQLLSLDELFPHDLIQFPELNCQLRGVIPRSTHMDMDVIVKPNDSGAILHWVYATGLFSRSTVTSLIEAYLGVLGEMLRDPSSPVLASNAEGLVLKGPYGEPPIECLHQLFEHRAAQSPHQVAVEWSDRSLSYAQLDRQANALAQSLRMGGVERGMTVGLCLERSLQLPSQSWVSSRPVQCTYLWTPRSQSTVST